MLAPDDEARAIDLLIHRLADSFAGIPAETVRAVVHACYNEYKGKPIRDFVPVLVERDAKLRLTSGVLAF
jgi:hypothetical protein